MKISIDWLKEFVDFDLSPQELAETLTAIGIEASVPRKIYDFDGVVVGRVLEVIPISNSDQLTLCQVNIGSRVVPIVCGAPNVSAGQHAPVATVGATLRGGRKVKKTNILGQLSQGVLCAEDELGLSDDHLGIIVLKNQVEPGQDFKDYLKSTGDTNIDLDLTPNRGDCFSHLGVGRDLAAWLNTTVRLPKVTVEEGPTPVEELASVQISAPEACHRYAARVIAGVKVGPSPDWLVERLRALDQRPINNVVDASNYVLMELGHPLHTFDYDSLAGFYYR